MKVDLKCDVHVDDYCAGWITLKLTFCFLSFPWKSVMAPRKGKVQQEQVQVSLGPQVREGEVVFGVAHIFASFNDTFVHVTDLSGRYVIWKGRAFVLLICNRLFALGPPFYFSLGACGILCPILTSWILCIFHSNFRPNSNLWICSSEFIVMRDPLWWITQSGMGRMMVFVLQYWCS